MKIKNSLRKISGAFYCMLVCSNFLSAQVSVVTQHNNLSRTGANLNETQLNISNVNGAQFGKLFTRNVDDQIYAQLLIVSNVNISGKGKRNVVYCSTVNNSIYAFDADSLRDSIPLWQINLSGSGVPVRNTDMTGACGGNYLDFSGNIGVVGTPVIDTLTKTLYVVARTKEAGTTFVQRLHAIDITDGTEKPNSPVIITAKYPGTGEGGDTIVFNPQKQNQRSGLLLLKGIVYICWASHCDWGPYHGWIMGYDSNTLQQKYVYNDTPNGINGGIWMSGAAPAADTSGNIYVTTGNGTVGSGTFNPWDVKNRGESFLKLSPFGNTLKVASWFTPYNYSTLEKKDLDLGSAGPLLVPETKLVVSGSKQGLVYVVDKDSMGGFNYLGNQDVQDFTVNLNNNIHGSPVYWKGPGGPFIYIWAENDTLKAYQLNQTSGMFNLPAYGRSLMGLPSGMPGAMLSISANGNTAGTGIIWTNHPLTGDANHGVRPGILRAFDAANISNELWNSEQNPARDSVGRFAKFNGATVANGKVYNPTFSNQFAVYGSLTVTSTEATHTLEGIDIYPNPSAGQFTLNYICSLAKTEKIKITISDVLARTISAEYYTVSNGNNKINLNVSNARSGTYLITVESRNNKICKRISVIR